MDLGKIFKAYDVRGRYPDEINEAAAKRIAQAYAAFLKPKTVAVGRDVRVSGASLERAVVEGLTQAGVNVVTIGQVPTEVLYFSVGYYHYDGGIQVSASHNPAEFNGLKLVGRGVEAISSDSGLLEIRQRAESDETLSVPDIGQVSPKVVIEDYLDFLAQFSRFDSIPPLKIVANNNYGLSGPLAALLLRRLANEQVELVELNFRPDGTFPKGRPDPLIEENRRETSELIRQVGADMGVAWDADGDRCYISDERGEVIEGCHLTAVLAVYLLRHSATAAQREKVLFDPRNIWAIEETVRAAGGIPIVTKAGHTFIKSRMRSENALFAGEASGHFYFRDFYFADSGLIPLMLFLNRLNETGQSASALVEKLRQRYFVSGEINFEAEDKEKVVAAVAEHYPEGKLDRTDGLSLSFDSWRLNLRPSNTENLLRLNIEARDPKTVTEKTAELSAIIKSA